MCRTVQQHEREQAIQDHTLSPSLHSELQVRDRSLICQAASVLSEPDPQCKADQTRTVAKLWNHRQLAAGSHDDAYLRERPSRDDSRVSLQLAISVLLLLCPQLSFWGKQLQPNTQIASPLTPPQTSL